jgi:beta-glucosidase
MIKFPEDFYWGAATSAYQVEGNNVNSDWWEWEKSSRLRESSGEASRHYHLFKEDFLLARQLYHNAHRLSLEWSRIEPQRREFCEKEIGHYRQVIGALKALGIEPIVTLHHFTNPLWFRDRGGWQDKEAVEDFLAFVEKIVTALSDQVRFWVTINEPMVYVYYSYILGQWPPGESSFFKARQVTGRLSDAHLKAYRLIHAIYAKNNLGRPMVSVATNAQAFQPCINTFRNRLATHLRNSLYNFDFVNRLRRHRALDFMGINYYSRSLVEVDGWGLRNFLLDTCKKKHSQLKKNSLGWDIYPQGLYSILLDFKRYNLPVFVLENGICTDDDSLRWEFISSHLKNLHLAMQQGVEVLGYLYWSLIDNFEWDKGFGQRFGLIAVDYRTYKRTIRESAFRFAKVCQTGLLEDGINQ